MSLPEISVNDSIIPKLGLNPKQLEAVLYLESPLLILAGAGTGKTKTLISKIALLINSGIPASRILAITFTNKAAEEMRNRIARLAADSAGIWMYTFHSLGARLLRHHYKLAGLKQDFVIYDEDDQKKLINMVIAELGFEKEKNKAAVYTAIISRAKDDLLDAESYLLNARVQGNPDRIKAAQIYFAYQKKLAESNAVDFGDLIVKAVELLRNNQELREYYEDYFRYLLVDEYQDTNRAQYVLIKTLSNKHKNLCVVGDPDQCLPPETPISTPGGIKKIEELKTGDSVISGLGWDKTGETKINKTVKKKFSGTLVKITTVAGKTFSATPNHICFARLDPAREMNYVYLMFRKDKGYRIGVTSGVRSSKDGAIINGIMVRTNQEVADAIWILKACRTQAEAKYFEQYFSVEYGIPTMVFHVRGRRMAIDQKLINRLFTEIDTISAAENLMEDLNLNPEYPHHRPFAVKRGEFNRKYVWFTAFGESRKTNLKPWHAHKIQLVTSDSELKVKAKKKFPVRDGNRGTWRIETSRKSYDEALKMAEDVAGVDSLDVVSRARLCSSKAFYFMPASHLREGMSVPVIENEKVKEDLIKSVENISYNGPVYDISVPNLRNFSAGGVLVHNSIYAWRGADIRNILEFEKDFKDSRTIVLEQNYRSTSGILDAANKLIRHNKSRKEKNLWTENAKGEKIEVLEYLNEIDEATGALTRTKELGSKGFTYNDIAVFYRTNAQSRNFEEAFRRARIPYRLIGSVRFYERKEIKDALAYLKILANPFDTVSLARVINTPHRGIGEKAQEKIMEYSRMRGVPFYDALLTADRIPDLAPGVRKSLRDFLNMFEEIKSDMFTTEPHQLLEKALVKSGYWQMIEDNAEKDPQDAMNRLGNLQELVNAVKEFEESAKRRGLDPTLSRYLEEVMLQSEVDKLNSNTEAVTLMTIHLAKGLEFPAVFLTGLEEGLFPINAANSDADDMEEERRLMYVGMTRAKKKLFISWADTRRVFGKTYPNLMSRFIIETKLVDYSANKTEEEETKIIEAYSMNKPKLTLNRKVAHPVYGPGRVAHITGTGEFTKVTVVFDSGVRQTFMLKYAPLEII